MRIINPAKKKRDILRRKILPFVVFAMILMFGGAIISGKLTELPEPDSEGASVADPVETVQVQKIHKGQISKNSNLYAELLNLELPQPFVADVTYRFSKMYDLKRSQPGETFTLFVGPDDSLVAFEYVTCDWKKFRIDRDGDSFVETISDIGLDRSLRMARGIVSTSLWDALVPQLPDMNTFYDMVEIFGWEIDFLTEPREGDEFKVIFEIFEKDGQFVKTGKILAAEYMLDDETHRAFLYTDPTGYQDYFNENGYSLRRTLLKSPLNYKRISSKFSPKRLHPIYKIYRPHLGVDYSAPIGTPVVSAGDGYVIYKGKKRGFGNYIEVRHPTGHVTCYGHLNDFAKGITKGRHVVQGQVIGFVGNTGESTGPHLDYRIRKNNKYINPLTMAVPAALPVKQEYKEMFLDVISDYVSKLEQSEKNRLFAQLD